MLPTSPLSTDRLETFTDRQWKAILEYSECFRCVRGDRLHQQGEVDNRLILILSGRVAMVRDTGDSETRTGIVKGRGETLSNSGFYLETPRMLSSVVDHDETRILVFRKENVFRLCSAEPEFTDFLFRNIAGQLYNTLDYVRRMRELSADKRVGLRVLELFRSHAEVPVTQTELAEIVGVSRVTVSKALGELESEGILLRQYGRIDVLKEAALATWVSPDLPVLGGNR